MRANANVLESYFKKDFVGIENKMIVHNRRIINLLKINLLIG